MRHYGTTNNIPAHQATPDRKPSEGTAAVLAGGGRAWPGFETTRHHTQHRRRRRCGGRRWACGAWTGFETTRRAKLAARTPSGRDAAHRHTQRPGPTWQAPRRPEICRGNKQQLAAPNKVRSPSLAGGRDLRRPEHQRGNEQHKAARPRRGRAAHASGR